MPLIAGFEVRALHGKKRLKMMIKTSIKPATPSDLLISRSIGPGAGIVFLNNTVLCPDAPLVFLIKTAFWAIPLSDQKCKTYIEAATGLARTRKSYSRPGVDAAQKINGLAGLGRVLIGF